MKLGISSYTYSWSVGIEGFPPPEPLTAMRLLNRAADMGVHVVQIADNMPLHLISDSELDDLAGHADELEIDVEVGTSGIDHDHLRTYLELSKRFRSPILRLVIDTADNEPSIDETVNIIGGVISEFEDAKVCLAVENHDRFNSGILREIIQRVGSDYMGICLDTANSFGALEGPEVVLRTLAPYAVNLHLKDFVVYRASHRMGFTIEGRLVGQGMLDVNQFLGEIRSYNRDPNVILEQWTPPEAKIVDTIDKEREWADESVKYLRRLIPD